LVGIVLVGLFVVGIARGVVTAFHGRAAPVHQIQTYAARPAPARVAVAAPHYSAPAYQPQYVAPPPPVPVYYPPVGTMPMAVSAAAMQAYLAQRNFYAPPPMLPPMLPPRFVFVRPGFGSPFGGFGHFAYGRRR